MRWLPLFAAGWLGVTGSAAATNDPAAGLRWTEADASQVLFTAEDIVRFDWERQVFELRRERAMELMAYTALHLYRPFVVRDTEGTIYEGRFFSPLSSQSYDGPTIQTGLTEIAPPHYAIQGGYPGGGGRRDSQRFDPRLHDALERAGLLKNISRGEKPTPIEKISTEWIGDRDKIRMRAEILTETFRLGQTARVHLFFTPGLTPPPAFDTVEIHSLLTQDSGFFCNTDHSIPNKLTPETIKARIYVLRWKPWGPVYGAIESKAKPGSAKLSLKLNLRNQTSKGSAVVCSVEIPAQKLTILPAVEASAPAETRPPAN